MKRNPWVATAFVFLLVAGPLLATAEGPGMVWDEGYTVDRAEKVRQWFTWTATGQLSWSDAVRADSIDRLWPFAREEPDGHPPLYALVALAGRWLAPQWAPPLASYRLGPILLVACTLAFAYRFLATRVGAWPATVAVLLCAYCPRLFAHGHFALYDMPLACWWLLAAMAFWRARELGAKCRWRALVWMVVTSALLAAGAATKFTGWLVPVPFFLATLLFWPRQRPAGGGIRLNLLLAAVAALPILVAVAPVLQAVRTLERLDREVRSELERMSPAEQRVIPRLVAERYRQSHPSDVPGWLLFGAGPALVAFALYRGSYGRSKAGLTAWEAWYVLLGVTPLITLLLVPSWWPDPVQRIALFLWSNLTRTRTTWIPTQFFGQVYEFGLPWYNTVAWLVLAMPPVTLGLVLAGTALAVRRLVRASENRNGWEELTVYFAIQAALLLVVRALPTAPGHDGIRQLVPSFVFLTLAAGLVLQRFGRRASRACGVLAVAWSVVATAAYHPVQLSYYSVLVGGLPGATRLGMEPTYYWDALDEPVRRWLANHTAPDEKIAFSSMPLSFHYLRQWGYLPVRFLPAEPGRLRWYVLQNRPGMFVARPVDQALAVRGRPAYVRRCLGVPLIWVFPIEELDRVKGAGN